MFYKSEKGYIHIMIMRGKKQKENGDTETNLLINRIMPVSSFISKEKKMQNVLIVSSVITFLNSLFSKDAIEPLSLTALNIGF